jgi:F-type H+-transporting ATPase subunit epsilon
MATTFQLEVATPERLLLREQVSEAQIPAANGYLGILPDHAPLLSELGIGELTYKIAGRVGHMAVSGGWVEVLPDHVRVVANVAEHAADIDAARAQSSLQRSEERLTQPDLGLDVGRALNSIKRAQARLAVSTHK